MLQVQNLDKIEALCMKGLFYILMGQSHGVKLIFQSLITAFSILEPVPFARVHWMMVLLNIFE